MLFIIELESVLPYQYCCVCVCVNVKKKGEKMLGLVSRLADRLEDDVVRQSLVILGCAVVAGVVLGSNKRSPADPADLSVRETVEREAQLDDAGGDAHYATSSVYAPADSYLLRLLREETDESPPSAENGS